MTPTAIPAPSSQPVAPPERPGADASPRGDGGFARELDRVSAGWDDNAPRTDDARTGDARAETKTVAAKGADRAGANDNTDSLNADSPGKAAGDGAAASGKKPAAKTPPAPAGSQAKGDGGAAKPAQAASAGQQTAGEITATAAQTAQAAATDGGIQGDPTKGGSTKDDPVKNGGAAAKESDADPTTSSASAQGGPPQPAIAAQPASIPLPGGAVPTAGADSAGATSVATATLPGAATVTAGVMAGPSPQQGQALAGKPSDSAAKGAAAKGDSADDAKNGSKTAALTGGATADPSAVGKVAAAGKLDPATLALLNRAAAGGDAANAPDPGAGQGPAGATTASSTSGAAVPLGGMNPAANGAPNAPVTAPNQPPPPTALAEQVAIQIARHAADGGSSRFEIRLDPAGLGRVDVRLDIHHDGRVEAAIAADRPETMALLNRDARDLTRALQNAGLKADSGSLSFSLRQDGGSGGSFFGGSGADPGGGPGRLARGGRAGDPAAQADAARPLQAMLLLWRRDGVDIRI